MLSRVNITNKKLLDAKFCIINDKVTLSERICQFSLIMVMNKDSSMYLFDFKIDRRNFKIQQTKIPPSEQYYVMLNNVIYQKLLESALILLVIACSIDKTQRNKTQLVQDYYMGLNLGNFKLISGCVADSVITSEKDFILSRTRLELYQHFQWDSVFRPNYQIIDVKDLEQAVQLTVIKQCERIQFLQDTAMVYKVNITFSDGKITQIQTTDYVFLDFTKWQPRRNTLVKWIDVNHPELSGFVNDLTLNGAQNYIQAINLYTNEKTKSRITQPNE